jgi:butyrate kinase
LAGITAIAARGGILPPVKAGAYRINEAMCDRLRNPATVRHASNLAAPIAFDLSQELRIPSYIYDAVSVDELNAVARFSGMPEIPRRSNFHALNSRAVAYRAAAEIGKHYSECSFIVAHLGGGISLSAHDHGKVRDVVADDEGPFSPERAGRVPCQPLIDLCYNGKFTKNDISLKLRGEGGMKAYLGTSDANEAEKRIAAGDELAMAVYKAMAYQISKSIGEMSTVLKGRVDAILLTGGLAASKMLTGWIVDSVKFIAPVRLYPGEFEMQALAEGILRVLNGAEEAHEYLE